MTLLHILTLALVQGITEFLPISSSAHLVLLPVVTGWPDQGLMIDVAAHFGSLAAILVYFWRDVLGLTRGFLRLVTRRERTREGLLAVFILIATVPAVGMGLAIKEIWPLGIRDPQVIAVTSIGFGLLLYVADRYGRATHGMLDLGWRGALAIGCAQAVALIPGTSRSGITMTAARFLGLTRIEAARFSFLLSIPAVAGASLLEGLELAEIGTSGQVADAILSAGFTFVTALAAIIWLMRWLRSSTFLPFVIYRLVLGFGLLIWIALS